MKSLNVGCAAREIPVPLFTELYGYGPFLGRRNRGVHDPLLCRAASFSHGKTRLIIISNDLVTMDPERAWEVRSEVGRHLRMPGTNVMICGSHTHSGPTISPGIGWGELNPDFVQSWKRVAVAAALEAAADESRVTATAGSQPLRERLGTNRVIPDGPTDPDIRWVCFSDSAETPKLLIHNHGMHGVVFGKSMLLVSADWPGAANRKILDQGLARNVMFLQGPAGNINTVPLGLGLEDGELAMEAIAEKYTADLSLGLRAGTPVDTAPLAVGFERVEMPSEEVTADYVRDTAAKLRALGGMTYQADRMEEMAIYMEAGGDIGITTDFQVFRIGGLYVYAVPGELFVELGMDLISRSPGAVSLVATLANDNLRYIPTPQTFAANPEIVAARRGYGYYETQFAGYGRYRACFKPNVGPFLVDRMHSIASGLCLPSDGAAAFTNQGQP